jgi:hypothetical protein
VGGQTDSERFFALMTVAIREHQTYRAGIIATGHAWLRARRSAG